MELIYVTSMQVFIAQWGLRIRDGPGAPVSIYLGYQLEMLVHEGEAFRLLEAVGWAQ